MKGQRGEECDQPDGPNDRGQFGVLHRPVRDVRGRVRVAKKARQADPIALTGFQSATTRSQSGIPWAGTKVFETNTRERNESDCGAAQHVCVAEKPLMDRSGEYPLKLLAMVVSRRDM